MEALDHIDPALKKISYVSLCLLGGGMMASVGYDSISKAKLCNVEMPRGFGLLGSRRIKSPRAASLEDWPLLPSPSFFSPQADTSNLFCYLDLE